MNPNRRSNPFFFFFLRAVFLPLLFATSGFLAAQDSAAPATPSSPAPYQASGADKVCHPDILGSPFIPVDSWIYPAMWRLYALGYVDTDLVYLGMRPWTRASVVHMLEGTGARLEAADTSRNAGAEEAEGIYESISEQLRTDMEGPCGPHEGGAQIESVYSMGRGISGTPLRDSYHLGQSIVNDYGRPYANGFNNYSGVSGYATSGRFAFYVRTEYQGAPSAAGYSPALYQTLATLDGTVNPITGVAYPNQATIPEGPIAAANYGRFLEAYVSFQYWNHVISFGKQDQWLGPGKGGSFAYSNNAQNIYALHINRIEPLYIPGLSRLTGPFRYEFLIGPLRGHTEMPDPLYPGSSGAPQPNVIAPGDPWVHVEKVNFKPTENVELGFERTVIFGGEGHAPVNLKEFLRSFFSVEGTDLATKYGPTDPGARFGSFDFSYRLPFVRNWLTLYADGEVHDDISPADAPRRAGWRPGLYLSHVPGIAKLDIRAEGADTDPPVRPSSEGRFMYFEAIQRQGYTNQGQIFGDWIGRQAKGGQGWLTYHLSGNEWIQLSLRNQKADQNFIASGTTVDDLNVQVVKRIARDVALEGNFTLEHWKAPIYLPGQQTVTATTVQLTWYPERKVSF